MKNAIFACTDSKYGDFLVDNWYKSLKENVDLSSTQVVILDYGMDERQLAFLAKEKVIVKKCKRDGHVTCLRWRDMGNFLARHSYDQVMTTDGGDIIFQDDISELFENNKKYARAACEDFNVPFEDIFTDNFFSKENVKKIKSMLGGKPMINAGVIAAPQKLFMRICDEFDKILINKTAFGPEQVAINFILYRMGFKNLDRKYNFVITSSESEFEIKNGIFYLPNGEKIKIVHNAGYTYFFRPIKNFGYGKNYNELKRTTYSLMRLFYRLYAQINQLVKNGTKIK